MSINISYAEFFCLYIVSELSFFIAVCFLCDSVQRVIEDRKTENKNSDL